jgi:ArsR family transcriptional regulator
MNADNLTLHAHGARTEPACCEPAAALRLSAEEADGLATALKALGHPVRLQIVDLLSRYAGRVCVCDVEGQFNLSQPTISHHLKILREAGLVGADQRGLWTYYYVRNDAVGNLARLMQLWGGGE